jgi:hypothetical protein
MIQDWSENHSAPRNTHCEQSEHFITVIAGGIYNYDCALKGQAVILLLAWTVWEKLMTKHS